MISRKIRTTATGFTAVVLVTLALGCSNDNTVAPTVPISDSYSQKVAGGDSSSDNFATSSPGAPAKGIVIEGVSVPGIALGYTRAQVEDAYGDPQWCQSVNSGDFAFCSFPVTGGGQVDVRYRGADGGDAGNSPDDVVYNIRWFEQVSGWTTTAGVNTTLAAESPEDVVAAYPNAQITYNQFGDIYRAVDYQLGIEVIWALDFYRGTTHVNMAIFGPTDPPPPPEHLVRVTDIDLTARKVRGQRRVQAFVRVQNELDLAASGATVFALWIFPDGSTRAVEDVTSNSGSAYFEIIDIPRGAYAFTVENVVLEGYAFDSENSVLNASIKVK